MSTATLIHIDINGKPAQCKAQVQDCPRGEDNHIRTDDPKKAQEFAEERNLLTSQNGMFSTLSKPARKEPTVSISDNINEEYPYPHAHDLEKISTVLDAISQGAKSGISLGDSIHDDSTRSDDPNTINRQGHYYGAAAGYLGFLSHSGGGGMYETKSYELTRLGEEFVDADENERSQILKGAVENMPAMEAYRNAGGGDDGMEAAVEHMTRNKDIAEETALRSATTIKSWEKKVNGDDFDSIVSEEARQGSSRIASAIELDKQRQAEKQAKAEEARKKEDEKYGAQKSSEKQCMECFLIKNSSQFAEGSSVCVDCNE